ncbi:SHOCT-like domain-containing protein [Streptomyces griseoviridis]
MNEQCRQILRMLGEGRITAEEAERLIDALEGGGSASPNGVALHPGARPRYLRVVVDWSDDSGGDGPDRVDVRVPLQLLRAGVRLASLVPPQALTKVDAELRRSGIPVDLAELKPRDLEELIDQLDDVTVDVDQPDGKVRVFCE